MPRMKKAPVTRRGGKRTNVPRRRRRAPFSKNIVRTLGIPDKMIARLPYTDLSALIGASGQVQKSYNINSLYDPETAALNQQPLYFNQYMRLYKRFRVFKVDYAVTLWNTANTSAVCGSLSFDPQGQQELLDDIQSISKPYSKRFSLAPAGNTGSFKTIRGSIYLPRVFGQTPEQYRTSGLTSGTDVSNPQAIAQMSINMLNLNTGVACSVQSEVRYTCHTEFYDRTTVLGTDAPIEEA